MVLISEGGYKRIFNNTGVAQVNYSALVFYRNSSQRGSWSKILDLSTFQVIFQLMTIHTKLRMTKKSGKKWAAWHGRGLVGPNITSARKWLQIVSRSILNICLLFSLRSVFISLLRLREKDKETFEGKRSKDNNIMEIQDAKKWHRRLLSVARA